MDKLEQYLICKERGAHAPSDYVLTSNPPVNKCKYCGTNYRYEMVLHEYGVPEEINLLRTPVDLEGEDD